MGHQVHVVWSIGRNRQQQLQKNNEMMYVRKRQTTNSAKHQIKLEVAGSSQLMAVILAP